jgi:hypothetical protein
VICRLVAAMFMTTVSLIAGKGYVLKVLQKGRAMLILSQSVSSGKKGKDRWPESRIRQKGRSGRAS